MLKLLWDISPFTVITMIALAVIEAGFIVLILYSLISNNEEEDELC